MSYQYIQVEKQDHLTTITINRPQVRNALHMPANRELDQAFNEFCADDEAWVAILTGSGKESFSTGNDMKWLAEHGIDALLRGMQSLQGGFGGITSRFACFKPIIAAVNGSALGGGFEMVLACDIVVASESAVFGLPEPRVGIVAGAGGVQRLPRMMPYQLAMGLLLSGDTITAADALRYGIVNEITSQTEVIPAAIRWAQKIIQCAPLAVRAAKEGAFLGQQRPLNEIVGKLYPGLTTVMKSEDVMEGARAFAEKRPPVWKGK